MFRINSKRNKERDLDTDVSNVFIDSFTSLIRRAVQHNIQLLRQKNRPALVMKKARHSFRKEIRCMMHIYGDVKNPRRDSLCLVEKILRVQINLLLKKAAKVSIARRKTDITHEELVYLLRHKKAKLRRLLHHLALRDATDCISKNNYQNLSVAMKGEGKRVKLCVDFLNKLTRSNEYDCILTTSYKDPVKTRRLQMRFFHTLEMSDEQYVEYAKNMQVSFYASTGKDKFIKWLLEDNPTNLKLTIRALEIISYLARETVAEIVESSRAVQMNCYSPETLNQSWNTGDLRVSWTSESCTKQSDSAYLSELTSVNGNLMDNISTNCVSNFTDQSEERCSESIFQKESHSKPENINVCGSDYTEEEDDVSSMRHSRWDFGFKQAEARKLPIHPRSIRGFMHQSGMSNDFLNANVSKRKLKQRVLCL